MIESKHRGVDISLQVLENAIVLIKLLTYSTYRLINHLVFPYNADLSASRSQIPSRSRLASFDLNFRAKNRRSIPKTGK